MDWYISIFGGQIVHDEKVGGYTSIYTWELLHSIKKRSQENDITTRAIPLVITDVRQAIR